VAEFFLSDDDGRTWRKAKGYGTLPGAHTRSGLQEPGVVELRNGVLWAWARTDLGRHYELFSHDGGETWSVPAPSRFTSPNSPLSMKHLPGSDRLLAIWNPGPSYETRSLKPIGGDRTPLVLATGVLPAGAWSRATLLDGMTEADEGYCYTAIHFTKDAVLLAYCAGGEQDKNRLARLRMRKLPLSALK
jgi:sialidase-1